MIPQSSADSDRKLLLGGYDAHDHHEIRQLVPGPAAQPTNLPIAETRSERDRRLEPKKLSFQLHGLVVFESTH